MPTSLVFICHGIFTYQHLAISVKSLIIYMLLIMELIVFLKEKYCKC